MLGIHNSRIGRSISFNTRLQTQEEDRRVDTVRELNGIYIGKEELVLLKKLSSDVVIPAIPEKFSQAFLESKHPFRRGQIGSHVILAFDPEDNNWHCLDRGEGGLSDVLPGSVNLSANKQDTLLDQVNLQIEGLTLSPAQDSRVLKRILGNAIAIHLQQRQNIECAPLWGVWGRTADVHYDNIGCRILLGHSNKFGVQIHSFFMSSLANKEVGLLCAWR